MPTEPSTLLYGLGAWAEVASPGSHRNSTAASSNIERGRPDALIEPQWSQASSNENRHPAAPSLRSAPPTVRSDHGESPDTLGFLANLANTKPEEPSTSNDYRGPRKDTPNTEVSSIGAYLSKSESLQSRRRNIEHVLSAADRVFSAKIEKSHNQVLKPSGTQRSA